MCMTTIYITRVTHKYFNNCTIVSEVSRVTQQCNMSPMFCILLAATSQFSIFTVQKMQLTGLDNANNVRNATCAETQTLIEWHQCSLAIP